MRWTLGRCWSLLVEHPGAGRDMGCVLPWAAVSDGLMPRGDTCDESGHARGFAGTARRRTSVSALFTCFQKDILHHS